MQMIRDFQKLWALLTCYGFKSHVNVTEGLEKIAEERIRVENEEAGTSTLYQAYDKFQENQDKAPWRLTRRILLNKMINNTHHLYYKRYRHHGIII